MAVQHRTGYSIIGIERCYPPLANDWANEVSINGWMHIDAMSYIQPGYVVGHPSVVGSGHCGIVDFDGWVISAGKYNVNRKYDKWLDGTSGYNILRNIE